MRVAFGLVWLVWGDMVAGAAVVVQSTSPINKSVWRLGQGWVSLGRLGRAAAVGRGGRAVAAVRAVWCGGINGGREAVVSGEWVLK